LNVHAHKLPIQDRPVVLLTSPYQTPAKP
jgi:hypothetical protein